MRQSSMRQSSMRQSTMRALTCVSLAVLLSGAAFAQAVTPPAFEIADVHVRPKTMTPRMSGGLLRGNRFDIRQATMLDLARVAYGLDADKVLGGPSWVELDRFDVLAKTAGRNVRRRTPTCSAPGRFWRTASKLVVRQEAKPHAVLCAFDGQGQAENQGG